MPNAPRVLPRLEAPDPAPRARRAWPLALAAVFVAFSFYPASRLARRATQGSSGSVARQRLLSYLDAIGWEGAFAVQPAAPAEAAPAEENADEAPAEEPAAEEAAAEESPEAEAEAPAEEEATAEEADAEDKAENKEEAPAEEATDGADAENEE